MSRSLRKAPKNKTFLIEDIQLPKKDFIREI